MPGESELSELSEALFFQSVHHGIEHPFGPCHFAARQALDLFDKSVPKALLSGEDRNDQGLRRGCH